MKKTLLTMVLVLAAGFLFYGTANAISGVCSGCHTMHNSQDGVDLNASPNDILLKDDCLGCHTTAAAVGPRVDNPTFLSAGSFADSFVTSATNTHNVLDLTTFNAGAADNTQASNDPPGWGGTAGAFAGANQLKCAGTTGCHGSHDAKASSWDGIQGYHHTANVYKFLQINADNSGAATVAVVGQSSADYEAGGAVAGNHNVYTTGATGISLFCSNCHEDFHVLQETNANALWNRHPTDQPLTLLPTLVGVTVDYAANPFAFSAAVATTMNTTTAYTTTDAQVMCLSCHRAHASQYADLLRFNYASQSAGGGATTGCLGCHVNQR